MVIGFENKAIAAEERNRKHQLELQQQQQQQQQQEHISTTIYSSNVLPRNNYIEK